MMGKELSPPQPHPLGIMTHYSLGIGPGALYGALRHRMPALTMGRGTLFGFGLFLVQDEAINALTGLSGKPQDYPWQAHARGLVAHVIFGSVTDTALTVLDRAGDKLARQWPSQAAWSETQQMESEDFPYPPRTGQMAEPARH